MFMRRVLSILLIVGLVLLIATFSLLAAGRLLTAMNDKDAAHVLDVIAMIVAATFALDLVCLVPLQFDENGNLVDFEPSLAMHAV